MKRASMSLIAGVVVLSVASISLGDFVYPNFSSTAGLQTLGTAVKSGTSLRVVSEGNWCQVGAAWRSDKQLISQGFDTSFTFKTTNTADNFGDGFAFVVQNSAAGVSAAGSDGGGIGYASNENGGVGIANSLALEVDFWDNGPSFPDPNSETASESTTDRFTHLSIQTRGTLANSPSHDYSLGYAQANAIKDGNVHTLRLLYQPGTLDVFFDNGASPAITAAVDFSSLLSLDNGQAYVGFTASAGGGSSNQDVTSWSFQSVPEPATLLMLAVGGLLAARRRR
jgi:hypothetical protein